MLKFPTIKGILIALVLNLLLMLFVSGNLHAQSGKIPPFQILQPNGKVFQAKDLPLGKPIVIVYFSPECEDCHAFIKELLARMSDFHDVSFAMITFLPVETVTRFANGYKINQYPNIFIGTEGASFFVRNYYGIAEIPFVAIYSKDGDLITMFRQEVSVPDVLESIPGS